VNKKSTIVSELNSNYNHGKYRRAEVFGEKISVKTLKRIIKKNCVGAGDGNLSKASAMRMSSGKRKKRSKF